jgi:alpha-galactosidase
VLHVLIKSKNNRVLVSENDRRIWVADDTESNDKFLAFFNPNDNKPISEDSTPEFHGFTRYNSDSEPLDSILINLDLEKSGLHGKYRVRDLWSRQDLREFTDSISLYVRNHGARLIRLSPVE